METLFDISSVFVMPFWFLMIFLGWWGWARRIMASPWTAIGPAVIYIIVVVPIFGTVLAGVSNPTLAGITDLLSTPAGTTLAWVHFLAFDLLVGRWVYLDSRTRNIPWWQVSPLLFFVLMLGPVGFVGYLLLRAAHERNNPAAILVDALAAQAKA